MTLPIRAPARRRRGRSIDRASSFVSWIRLLVASFLLLTAAGFYALTTSPVFGLDPAQVHLAGLHYTDAAVALTALGLDGGAAPNLFHVRTGEMEAVLARLPAVRAVSVRAILPDALEVTVVERDPILIWQHEDAGLLTDVDGLLFAPASASDTLPVIADQRASEPALVIGSALAASDLAVARVLGAVTPADLESSAPALTVSIQDADGWVIEVPGGWRAVFGHYTPELRPPSIIDGQVQCLAALLATGEADVRAVTLALTDQTCGTYIPRPSPTASPSPAPTRTRRP